MILSTFYLMLEEVFDYGTETFSKCAKYGRGRLRNLKQHSSNMFMYSKAHKRECGQLLF